MKNVALTLILLFSACTSTSSTKPANTPQRGGKADLVAGKRAETARVDAALCPSIEEIKAASDKILVEAESKELYTVLGLLVKKIACLDVEVGRLSKGSK